MVQSPDVDPLRPASRVRLADQVVTILIDAMLDGRLVVGETLPPERQLAVELDVNRTSLRQAIALLEQMGVVEARQGRGTMVRDVATSTDPALIAHLIARERPNVLVELLEIREALAGLIGRLAAQRATAGDRRALRSALDGVRDATMARERQERELAFFRVLVTATRNRPLVAMQEWVDQAYGDAADLFADAFTDGDVVCGGLEPIARAVDAGDAGAASEATTAYAVASAERLLAATTRRRRRPTQRGGTR